MYEGMPLSQLQATEKIPQGSTLPLVMGDGSGTKKVTKETLAKETGEELKIGNLDDLKTQNKSSLVEAINEAAQSGGGGASVDILDTKEEVEANTESGKTAGALALKEMFGALNDNLKKSVSDGKSSVASAITAKGVATNADATFADMATNILSIQTDAKHTVYCIVSANPGGATIDIMIDNNLNQRMVVNAGQSYVQSNHFTV